MHASDWIAVAAVATGIALPSMTAVWRAAKSLGRIEQTQRDHTERLREIERAMREIDPSARIRVRAKA